MKILLRALFLMLVSCGGDPSSTQIKLHVEFSDDDGEIHLRFDIPDRFRVAYLELTFRDRFEEKLCSETSGECSLRYTTK